MMPHMNYKAVLFDLDGTLLDTLDDIADATNLALRGLGFPEHRSESYKLMVGDGVENLVRRVLPEGRRDAATVAACAERMQGEYARHWAVKTRPYDGIVELLDALAARGIVMAVLSNKPENFTRLCVEKLLPAGRFAVVIGSRPSLPKKPDPTGALTDRRAARPGPRRFHLPGRHQYGHANGRSGGHVAHRRAVGLSHRRGTVGRRRQGDFGPAGRSAGIA